MGYPDILDYAALGGELQVDHVVEDTSTDLPAEADCEMRLTTAQGTHTGTRAWVEFHWTGAAIVIDDHDAVWGDDVSVIPTIMRSSEGVYSCTWPATVADERGNTKNINIRAGWGNATLDVRLIFVRRQGATPSQVIILSYDVTGALADVTTPCDVFVI